MTSERQRNAGYILPQQIDPPDRICVQVNVPNTPEYIAAITGAISTLGKWWTWEKSYSPGDNRAKEAAEVWRKAIYETLVIGNCGGGMDCCNVVQDIEIIVNNIRREQNITNAVTTNNNLTTYNNFLSTYINNSANLTIVAPQLTNVSNENNDIYCVMTKILVDYICEAGILYNDRQQIMGGIGTAIVALAGTIATALTAGTAIPIGFAIGTVFASVYPTGAAIANVILQNKEARQAVVCCMYQALQSRVPTVEIFRAALNTCNFPPLSDQDLIRTVVANFLQTQEVHSAFLQATEEARRIVRARLAECDCPQTPIGAVMSMGGRTPSFSNEPLNQGGTARVDFPPNFNPANLVTTTGWWFVNFSGLVVSIMAHTGITRNESTRTPLDITFGLFFSYDRSTGQPRPNDVFDVQFFDAQSITTPRVVRFTGRFVVPLGVYWCIRIVGVTFDGLGTGLSTNIALRNQRFILNGAVAVNQNGQTSSWDWPN